MTTDEFRAAVEKLSRTAQTSLNALWLQVSDAVQARQALVDVLPGLIERYGTASGELAAQWYNDLRNQENVAGRFLASSVAVRTPGSTELARWGVSPLFQATPDLAASKVLVAGGLQRRIANVSRRTLTRASARDPQATGWQRVGDGECTFCRVLISRGAVYTRDTVDFGSHDHCNCQARPAFKGRSIPVKPYEPSLRDSTDADRERVRQWISANL